MKHITFLPLLFHWKFMCWNHRYADALNRLKGANGANLSFVCITEVPI